MEIVSLQTFLSYPNPEWRIDQLFESQGLVGLYGASGSGKTFIALDWALSIAAGVSWQGCPVRQGPTVYVVAEGAFGLRARTQAWLDANREEFVAPGGSNRVLGGTGELPPVLFLIESLPMLEGGAEDLVETLLDMDTFPKLVVIDTLARCFVGGDENEAADMSRFVASAGYIQTEVGATVVVVHHTGKDETREERGSSVLRAAADTMIRVEMPKEDRIELCCTKQKNFKEFKKITLRLRDEGHSAVLVCDGEQHRRRDVALAAVVLKAQQLKGTRRYQARQLARWTGKTEAACESLLRRV